MITLLPLVPFFDQFPWHPGATDDDSNGLIRYCGKTNILKGVGFDKMGWKLLGIW